MKSITIIAVITAFIFNFLFGAIVASIAGFNPTAGGVIATVGGVLLSFAKMPTAAYAGLLKEIWISKLMERFYSDAGFLSRSVDMTMFVENNTINLADCGVDPEVLVNNTTYPVPVVERTDSPIALPLDYFDTVNTVVRNAEAIQLAYPKLETVVRQHRNSLAEKCSAKAAHAYGPSADGAFTPVFQATGADRGDGKKALTLKDIAKAEQILNTLKVPQAGRILVLCPKHKEDLQNQDANMFKAFANLKTGEILPLFGFDIYVSQLTPRFNKTTGAKVAFGAAAAGTDTHSSVFFHEAEVMRADGTVDMFSRMKDPEARGDLVGFQKRFLGMPIRNKYNGAIFSPDAA
jgi:hypothetical protein